MSLLPKFSRPTKTRKPPQSVVNRSKRSKVLRACPRKTSQLSQLKRPFALNPHRSLSRVISWWKWELLALLLCAASLGVIIITLVLHENRPLPKYTHGITLNAWVAIFSTIIKSTMLYCVAEAVSQHKWISFGKGTYPLSDVELFDQASRGPWGSFQLLRS